MDNKGKRRSGVTRQAQITDNPEAVLFKDTSKGNWWIEILVVARVPKHINKLVILGKRRLVQRHCWGKRSWRLREMRENNVHWEENMEAEKCISRTMTPSSSSCVKAELIKNFPYSLGQCWEHRRWHRRRSLCSQYFVTLSRNMKKPVVDDTVMVPTDLLGRRPTKAKEEVIRKGERVRTFPPK